MTHSVLIYVLRVVHGGWRLTCCLMQREAERKMGPLKTAPGEHDYTREGSGDVRARAVS